MRKVIDARDVRSPAPFIYIEVAFRSLAIGGSVEVESDDPTFPADCQLWCDRSGHQLVTIEMDAGVFRAEIKKGR